MLSLLAGLVVAIVVGVALYVRSRDLGYLTLMPLLGLAVGLILAMAMGVMVPHTPIDVIGEYPLRAFDGDVYVVEKVSEGTYSINTGLAGFDSKVSVERSGLVFDSRVKPEVVVYSLGHVGYLKYFTFVPNGMLYYRMIVPDKNSVKKIP